MNKNSFFDFAFVSLFSLGFGETDREPENNRTSFCLQSGIFEPKEKTFHDTKWFPKERSKASTM